MSRIFLSLAVLNSLALAATYALGFVVDAHAPDEAAQRLFTSHFLIGLFTAVFTLLVHSVVFTYFVGTGRWVKEIGESYPLKPDFSRRSRNLKRRAFAWALSAMFAAIATAVFGAASDTAPRLGWEGWAGLSPTHLHWLAATVTIAFNTAAYFGEFVVIRANMQLIHEVMSEVKRIRTDHGLAPDSPVRAVSQSRSGSA